MSTHAQRAFDAKLVSRPISQKKLLLFALRYCHNAPPHLLGGALRPPFAVFACTAPTVAVGSVTVLAAGRAAS
jgi:hypothetical protein